MIVIPSCREKNLWEILPKLLEQDSIIVCEDNDEKTFSLPEEVQHYSHKEIKDELGDKAYIIPRKNASIRSFGYYKAWQQGSEWVITIDDDCIPGSTFVLDHIDSLKEDTKDMAWINTIIGAKARGMPFNNTTRKQETLINHGLWTGNADLDAVTQLTNVNQIDLVDMVIPKGQFYPMSGMNLSFKRKACPMMYFLLMGEDYIYDRFDDIWAGIFTKKICDHLNYGVKSGQPYVLHTKASNIWKNLEKENAGLEYNETLWSIIDNIILTRTIIIDCYEQIAEEIYGISDYFDKLSTAMKDWVSLYV